MLGRLCYGIIGLLLLPAVAGLGLAVYALLIDTQLDASGSALLFRFMIGSALWIVLFLTLTKPMRSYVLAHEMSHVLAAWISGQHADQLKVGANGGSVRVSQSNLFIALAPYMLPFYSLLLFAFHLLASLWWDPRLWSAYLPLAFGFTWSFHITFTLLALSRKQSDLHPYGLLGAFPVILLGNLLILVVALSVITPAPLTDDARIIGSKQVLSYRTTAHHLRTLFTSSRKITIIRP
jgi:hypothetical protein